MSPHPWAPVSPAEEDAHHRLGARLAGLEVPEFVAPGRLDLVVAGLRLRCLDWGHPDRPPVLFLHGGGQTARTWDLVCLALRRELRCLALDQRGHGDSEWSYAFDYAPEHHVRDIAGVLDALRISRVAIVGMSMGCLNGLEFALRHPDRVSAFVAVDAGPWVRVDGARAIVDFTTQADGSESLDALIDLALRFNPRRDPRLLGTSLRHNLRRLPDGRLTWKTDRRRPFDLGAIRERLDALKRRVPELRVPTLILRGAESEVFLDEHAERFAASLADARWSRIEGAGHTIQGDAPARLVAEIRAFFEGRLRREGAGAG